MRILVTGAAGFIGFHVCRALLGQGHHVVGLDNLNHYYDVRLKLKRLEQLGIHIAEDAAMGTSVTGALPQSDMRFIRMDLVDRERLPALFAEERFDVVCNLAAQAGVRYSLEEPFTYAESNMIGFLNVLEACRHHGVKRLVYASSSSVYGKNAKVPFSVQEPADSPISLYAATKKSNELMAHTYAHLFGINAIGLRFFTVYGPWCRPDMALFLFTDAIFNGRPIKVYNNGQLWRDFTYIDDVVNGVLATIGEGGSDGENYRIYNIGNSRPVKLMDFIEEIERCTGMTAKKEFLSMQPGDMERTWADVSELESEFGYKAATGIAHGVGEFVRWYRTTYGH